MLELKKGSRNRTKRAALPSLLTLSNGARGSGAALQQALQRRQQQGVQQFLQHWVAAAAKGVRHHLQQLSATL